MQLVARDTDLFIKLQAFFFPIFEQVHSLLRSTKIFELHLLELAGAKREIARVDFITKRLADLRDSERQFLARYFEDVFKLNEDRLCCFRTQIGDGSFVNCGTYMRLEHQVKLPRRSQILTAAIWTLFNAFLLDNL